MTKKFIYGYIIVTVICVVSLITSNNTIAAQDQNNNTINTIITEQNQTNTTIAEQNQFSSVPFKEIPLVIINSVYHEDKFGADFSIDFGDETVIEQDFSASSVPNMQLDKDDTTLSLQLLCDSSDICDASLAPDSVHIYLVDDAIQDIHIAQHTIPTIPLGSKNCGSLSIKDCANLGFSIPGNIILDNYKIVVDMSFDEARWIFINPVEIVDSICEVTVDTISGILFNPIAIAYDHVNERMYAGSASGSFPATPLNSTVYVIDTTKNTVTDTILVGLGVNSIAYDHVNERMYVANLQDDTVSVIDTKTNKVIGNPIPVGNAPFDIAYDPINERMYVVTARDDAVSVIDTNTNTVVGSPIPVGDRPLGIAYDHVNERMYVTIDASGIGDGTVIVIDTTTNTVVGSPIPVGNDPLGIAYDPINERMYVANFDQRDNEIIDTVSVISTNTNTVTDTIPVGDLPRNLAYDPVNQDMYVVNQGDGVSPGTVSVIDTTKNTVTDTIPLGLSPTDIAYDSVNHRMYVTNAADDTVSVINLC